MLDEFTQDLDDILAGKTPKKRKPVAPIVPDRTQEILDRMRGSASQQESGGNTKAVNPRTGATGEFQVLPANIPNWTKKYYKRQLTVDEFRNDPQAQQAVFNGEMGKYVRRALQLSNGDEDKAIRMAASAWYGGEGAYNRYDNPKRFRANEPSYREYTTKVLERTKGKTKNGFADFLKGLDAIVPPTDSAANPLDDFTKGLDAIIPAQPTTNPNATIAPQISAIPPVEETQTLGETQPIAPTVPAEAPQVTKQSIKQFDTTEYAKYLKYTGKQDSPTERTEFEKLSKPEGFSTEVSDVQVDSPKIEIPNDAYKEVSKNETSTRKIDSSNVKDVLDTVAGRVEVDLSKKPKGMAMQEFIFRSGMKALAGKYNLSDADIDRAVEVTRSLDGNLLINGSEWDKITDKQLVGIGNYPHAVNIYRANISAAKTGKFDVIDESVKKDFDTEQAERNINLLTSDKPVGKDEFDNPIYARDISGDQTRKEAEEKRAEQLTRDQLQADSQNRLQNAAAEVAEASLTPLGFLRGAFQTQEDVGKTADEVLEKNVSKVKNQFGSFSNYQSVQNYYNDMDWGDTAVRMAVNVGRGFVKTVVSDVLKGADFLDSFNERYNPIVTLLPENMRPSLRNLGNGLAYTIAYLKDPNEAKNLQLAGIDDDIDKKAIYQLGKYIDDSLGEDEVLRNRFLGTLSNAAGSGLGFALMGFVAPQLSITTRLGEFALSGAGLGAVQSAGSGYSEAKKSGLSETDARTYGIISGILGATEGFGIGAAVSKAIKNPEVKRAFLSDFLGFIKQKGKNFAEGGAEETFQEFVQSTGGKIALDALKDKEPSAYQKVLNIIERLPAQIGEVAVENLPAAFLTGGAFGVGATSAVGDTLVKDEPKTPAISPQEIEKRTDAIIRSREKPLTEPVREPFNPLGDKLKIALEQKETPKEEINPFDVFAKQKATQTETPKVSEQKQESANLDDLLQTRNTLKEQINAPGLNKSEVDKLYERYVEIIKQIRPLEEIAKYGTTSVTNKELAQMLSPLDKLQSQPTERAEKVSEDADLGSIYKVKNAGILFRGVTVEDWQRIQKQGFIDSDFRGAISQKEGVNLANTTRAAFDYIPSNSKGLVLAIDVKGFENDLFMIGADNYIRTKKPIPLDKIVQVSQMVTKNEDGRFFLKSDNPIVKQPAPIKANKPQKEFNPGDSYEGKGFRVESNLIGGGKTAREIIDFEADELGNKDFREQAEIAAKKHGINLADISAKDVLWLTTDRKTAKQYTREEGDIEEFNVPKNSIVLAGNKDDGYLMLLGGKSLPETAKDVAPVGGKPKVSPKLDVATIRAKKRIGNIEARELAKEEFRRRAAKSKEQFYSSPQMRIEHKGQTFLFNTSDIAKESGIKEVRQRLNYYESPKTEAQDTSVKESTPISHFKVGDRVQDVQHGRKGIIQEKNGEQFVIQSGSLNRIPISDKWKKTSAQIKIDRQTARLEARQAKSAAKGKPALNPLDKEFEDTKGAGKSYDPIQETPDAHYEALTTNANVRMLMSGVAQIGYEKGKVSSTDVIKTYEDVLKAVGKPTPIRTGRGNFAQKKAASFYDVKQEIIRLRTANNIPSAGHEIGHGLQKYVYGAVKASDLKQLPMPVKRELVQLGKDLYGTRRPNGGYASEGFAEFTRLYLTTEDVARKAPNLLKWFEAEILDKNPKIAEALQDARETTEIYRMEGAENRAKANTAKTGTAKENIIRAKRALRQLPTQIIDEFTPLLRLSKDAGRIIGKTLEAAEDPFKVASFLRGNASATTHYFVFDGTMDFARNIVGEPLDAAVSIVRGKKEAFSNYLIARRAQELLAENINPGMTKEDADTLVQLYDSPEFQLAATKVHKWQDDVLNYAREASPNLAPIIDKIFGKGWKEYVPLMREFDDIDLRAIKRVNQAGGNPLKRIQGSGRRIKDIFPQMITNAEKLIALANRQRVLDTIVKLSDVEGMGHIIEEVPVDKIPVSTEIAQIKKQLEDSGADLSKVDLDEVITFFSAAHQPKGLDPIVPMMKNGEMKWFQVDETLYNTLSGLDLYRLPKVLDIILGVPTRMFRLGTTGLRPAFSLITNPTRDIQTFFMQSRESNPAKLVANYFTALAQALNPKRLAGKSNKDLDLFYRFGANLAQPLGADQAITRRTAKELFQGKVLRKVMHPVEMARELLSVSESVPRVAEIRNIAKEIGWDGKSPLTFEQAVQMGLGAKQVTVDFSASGSFGKKMNQAMPFFNANVQGTRQFAKNFRDRPQRTVLYGSIAMLLPTLLLWWKNKDEEWYKEMLPRERFMYWNFESTDGKSIIQIPRAFEWGNLFAVIPETLADAWYNEDPQGAKHAFGYILDTSTPPVTPHTLQIAKEQWQNRIDFFDTPIVPKGEENMLPGEQKSEGTTALASALGDYFPNTVSPRRFEHILRGLTGGVSIDVVRAVEQITGIKSGKEKEMADVFVVGKLFRRGGVIGYNSKTIDKFYDEYGKLQKLAQSDDKEKQKEGAMYGDAQKVTKALKQLRELNTQDKSPESRNARNLLMREIAKKFLRAQEERQRIETNAKIKVLRDQLQEARKAKDLPKIKEISQELSGTIKQLKP